jgi:signal transduction histidine kinase/CheY-like chemotaxis protein
MDDIEVNQRSQTARQYGFSILLLLIVYFLRLRAHPFLGDDAPFLPFLLAVIFSSWLGTISTGLFTTLAGAFIGSYFFMKPYYDLAAPNLFDVSDIIRLGLYLCEGVSLSVVIGSLKKTKKALQAKTVELKQAKDNADASNKTKSLFLANMSHEIRTPMSAILGFTEIMLKNDLHPTERSEYLNIIRRNAQALGHLIDGILDLSKIEAGKLRFESSAFSPQALIREVAVLLDIKAKEKGISLKLSMAGLPSLVYSDSSKIRQVLINVISNAIKFTQKGFVEIFATFDASETQSGLIKIRVQDSGIGVTPEQQRLLFQPFVQADGSTTRKFGGTGLGLSLSRQIARNLGGDVSIENSVPGAGSTFIASFHVGVLEEIDETVTDMITNSTASNEQAMLSTIPMEIEKLKGKKALLVEDSPDNRLLITYFLKSYGMEVDVAVDGIEGVGQALSKPHDVILMDIQMPGMDGFDALDMLRKRHYSGKVIALTAHSMVEERQRCLDSGFDSFLSKPVSSLVLAKGLSEVLN